MNGTVQIVVAAISLASQFAPYAIAGVKDLWAAIEARKAAGKPITHQALLEMADEHGVDLAHVGDFIKDLTPKGQ